MKPSVVPPSSTTGLVMVVEDDPNCREMYAHYLGAAGFRVLEANNGLQAIEKAVSLLPDVIVLDMELPALDGWAVLERVKEDEATRHIRVVIITGHAQAGDVKRARQGGCASMLIKPCLPHVLLDEVRRVLTLPADEPWPVPRSGTS